MQGRELTIEKLKISPRWTRTRESWYTSLAMAFIPLSQIAQSLQQTGKYWIAFSGDSITSCEWVHPNWRDIVIYVLHGEMQTYMDGDWQTPEWGIRGFNFAYDGATTKDIVGKLDDLLMVKPHLVIGLMGGNDPVLGVSVEQSVQNIGAIANRITAAGVQIVWCNSTPAGEDSKKNPEYEPYAQAFLAMPAKDNFFKLDMFNLYRSFPTEKFFTFISEANPVEGIKAGEPDLQHPNQLGNAYIAKIILDQVFGIAFDPEKYIADTIAGLKLPGY